MPIGADDERSAPNPPATSAERAVSRAYGRDAADPVATADVVPRGARPLPGRSDFDDSATGTASIPRVTRIQIVGSGASTTTDGDDGFGDDGFGDDGFGDDGAGFGGFGSAGVGSGGLGTGGLGFDGAGTGAFGARGLISDGAAAADAAPFDPLSTEADSQRSVAASTNARAASARGYADDEEETLAGAVGASIGARSPPVAGAFVAGPVAAPDSRADGTLVVEAPPEAVVVVNGIERGRGHVRVAALDRHARHVVRIQRPGFHTWSGSVSLDGKVAARIRPTLKPRAR